MQIGCPRCFPDTVDATCPVCQGGYFVDDCGEEDVDEWENSRCMHCSGDGSVMDDTCPVCEGTGRNPL